MYQNALCIHKTFVKTLDPTPQWEGEAPSTFHLSAWPIIKILGPPLLGSGKVKKSPNASANSICLAFNHRRYEVSPHHGRSSSSVYDLLLPSKLPPMPALSMILMLSCQAVRGLPRALVPGMVPSTMSISKQSPDFLMTKETKFPWYYGLHETSLCKLDLLKYRHRKIGDSQLNAIIKSGHYATVYIS